MNERYSYNWAIPVESFFIQAEGKNTMSYMCVHVGLQWYKIHIKYNNNNICRINTVRILHIQHTLEQCHMNNKSWGRERTWISIWLLLMCLISHDLENLVKRSTHNYVPLMHEKAIPALASENKMGGKDLLADHPAILVLDLKNIHVQQIAKVLHQQTE